MLDRTGAWPDPQRAALARSMLTISSLAQVSAAIAAATQGGGSVPTVQVNVGRRPLVVLAGETIVGGRQNRIINVTVWLAPKKTTAIPVSCLEHGRWNAGHAFGAGLPVDVDFRGKVGRMVNDRSSMSSSAPAQARYAANQSAVWQEIEVKERLAARRSPTGALHDLYATGQMDPDKVIAAFPMPEDASGLAIGIGGRVVALDLFDSPAMLARQWSRLIISAALATFDHQRRVNADMLAQPEHRYPDDGALARMLRRARKATADASVNPSVGEGHDVRLATARLHGSALVHGGRVVHVALFRDEQPPKPPKPPRPERARVPKRTLDPRLEPAIDPALEARRQEALRFMREQFGLPAGPGDDPSAGVPARVRAR